MYCGTHAWHTAWTYDSSIFFRCLRITKVCSKWPTHVHLIYVHSGNTQQSPGWASDPTLPSWLSIWFPSLPYFFLGLLASHASPSPLASASLFVLWFLSFPFYLLPSLISSSSSFPTGSKLTELKKLTHHHIGVYHIWDTSYMLREPWITIEPIEINQLWETLFF